MYGIQRISMTDAAIAIMLRGMCYDLLPQKLPAKAVYDIQLIG